MFKIQNCVGYKLFKVLEDGSIDLLRIMHVRKYSDGGAPSEITVRDENTKEVKKVRVDSLSDYTPLEPDGYLTFNIISIKDRETNGKDTKVYKDVVVTASKFLNIKIGDTFPFAICRQSITDIFYNLLSQDENDMMVGLAVNQNDCPANFDFKIMLAADSILHTESVNFYRNDLLETIINDFVKVNKFDEVLDNLFKEHAKATGDPKVNMKKTDKGWCRSLKSLLHENNFQHDINEMLGITDVEFEIAPLLVEAELPGKEGETYQTCIGDLKLWLSSIYEVAIQDITFLEWGHDINLADFNDARYFLLRDSKDKLYLTVYTVAGEYHKIDLEAAYENKDFSTQFRLNFYNKYNQSNK